MMCQAHKMKSKVKMKVALMKNVLKTKRINIKLKNKLVQRKNNKAKPKSPYSSPIASIH